MFGRTGFRGPLAAAIAYFGAAWVSIAFTRFDAGIAFIWMANAIVAACLLEEPPPTRWRFLAATAVANVLVNGLCGFGWALAVPLAVANGIEAIAAVTGFRYALAADRYAERPRTLVRIVVTLGLVAPVQSALIAALALYFIGGRPPVATMPGWVVAHGLGLLCFTPACMPIVASLRGGSDPTRRRLPSPAWIVAMAAITWLCFGVSSIPLLFVPVLAIVLAIVWSDTATTAAMMAVLALVGGGLTIAGHGAFAGLMLSMPQKVTFFYVYLATTVLCLIPVAGAMSRRQRLHEELTESEARYRMLTEHSSDIVMKTDVLGAIVFVSPSVSQLGRYSPEEMVGHYALEFVVPEYHEQVRSAHQLALASPGETFEIDYLAITAGGEPRWFESRLRAVFDDDGKAFGVVSAIRDIATRKRLEAALEQAASTDTLTGLPNRRAFFEMLQRSAILGTCGCIAVIDLDHFKRINDSYGHAAGDAVLRTFARIARSTLRDADMVARIGGEEFALLLPGTGLAQGEAICDRLRATFAATMTRIGGAEIRVTASTGLAPLSRDPQTSLKAADAALYAAKEQGRDCLSVAA